MKIKIKMRTSNIKFPFVAHTYIFPGTKVINRERGGGEGEGGYQPTSKFAPSSSRRRRFPSLHHLIFIPILRLRVLDEDEEGRDGVGDDVTHKRGKPHPPISHIRPAKPPNPLHPPSFRNVIHVSTCSC